MATKKDYIKLIRLTWILESFTDYYFMRMMVIYLLSRGVTDWIAVSIPVVFEFASLASRGFTKLVKFALKVDYKKYHVFYQITFLLTGVLISQSKSLFIIYPLTLLIGTFSGIRNSTVTKLSTSNKEYEPFCLIEEERSSMIGGILGLLISQFIYDINPYFYILGYFILITISIIVSFFMKSINEIDIMEDIETGNELSQKDKKETIIVSTLYGVLVGFWCIAGGGFQELAPLISDKVGYLNTSYMVIEIVLLLVIGGNLLQKLKNKRKLLLTDTICAGVDIICLFIAAVTLSWKGLLIAFILSAITSTLGDPVWGSIISEYSLNNRKRYVLVNKAYFITRTIFQGITWYVCRMCVIKGMESFEILAIVMMILLIIFYIICDKVNRKIFKHSV